MEPINGLSGAKIALLVDFDNVIFGLDEPGFDIELVVNALRERGTIVLGRVYGDWYRHNRHRRLLMEQGLELVETPAFGPVIKNSADIRIALDGFEIGLTQPHIDTFAIVSGDSDFLPLIKKLQSLGRRVLVICGNRFTSDMLRRNCNEFISYENLLMQSVGATEDATTLDGAFVLLHRAMAALRERGTEIRGSGVKQMMLQLNPVFSERTFGCSNFRQFLNRAVGNGVVKLGPRDKASGEFHVLLPDEDELPVQQRVERRNDNRARRDDKLAQIAARIEAVPVEAEVFGYDQEQSEVEIADALPYGESDYSPEWDEGGAVFDEAFGYEPEPMSEARTESKQEIAQNVIARSELLSRGLRPTKRRFSGSAGRPELKFKGMAPTQAEVEAEDAPAHAPEAEVAAPTESRRLRSRRRRRSASGQITVVEEAAPVDFDSTQTAPEAGIDENVPRSVEPPPAGTQVEDIEVKSPLDSADEPLVENAEQVEMPEDAVAQIQTALDELSATQGGTDALAPSKGIEVEVSAPQRADDVDASAPSGQPLSVSDKARAAGENAEEPVKPKRRRPTRTKKAAPEAAPVELNSTEGVPEAQTEAAATELNGTEEAAVTAQNVEAAEEKAPAKPRRRRTTKKKTDEPND